jgi:hypothetical protein
MNREPIPNSTSTHSAPSNRRGTGTFDLLVAFTLLTTVITVATPLFVRHSQMLRSHRNYRLALDELSNQMDHLIVLSNDELPDALKRLTPSTFIAERLPSPQLQGELQPAEFGNRITLKLSWNETERRRAPVALAAWVFPSKPQSATAPMETVKP